MSASVTPRGLLFGSAAESYERYRLGYPDEVVDRVLAYAGRPVADALEVGAGTGKATRAFASHGVRVTAVEPDAEMCAVLSRETAAMPVTVVQCRFEEYVGERVDLVYAASAMHWTDEQTRWRRVHDLLVAGGVAAVFGRAMQLADEELADAVAEVERPLFADQPLRKDPDDGLAASGFFVDVENHWVELESLLPRREVVGYLSTVSAYLLLPLADRQALLQRVADLLPKEVRVDVGVGMTMGRRP
jgi:SAM-dependent methyltransferase